MAFSALLKKLSQKQPVLLAGAVGTEIQRRGVRTTLPLWSASALETDPDVVEAIHRDYIDAGAELITTNTFRTNPRTFEKIGRRDSAKSLTLMACNLARNAITASRKRDVYLGGSMAPVEDCYRLDLVPPDDELEREHDEVAGWFAEAGVDFLLLETLHCRREANAAIRAAHKTGIPFAVSFLCDPNGNLFSGESLEDAVHEAVDNGAFAILTNCRPLDVISSSVEKLIKISPVPVGVYANGDGHPDDAEGWLFEGQHPEERYADFAKRWLDAGVSIIGGCCGTTPEYIKRLRQLMDDRSGALLSR